MKDTAKIVKVSGVRDSMMDPFGTTFLYLCHSSVSMKWFLFCLE